jgi:predicted DNA-binding transcriptional regulator AlpA
MAPTVATEDLVDARDVAQILGLSHPSAVSVYQHRYSDMPRPVLDLGRGRAKLWLRPQIEQWATQQAAAGRTRPRRRAAR